MQTLIDERALAPFVAVVALWVVAAVEWIAYWRAMPRQPWLFTALATMASVWFGWRAIRARKAVSQLPLGRDGERVVGQFLDGLRMHGARIFHDIPADGFNLDHVVISTRGIFAVETKTLTKPGSGAKVVFDGESVLVAGRDLDRDPVNQAVAQADWLQKLLKSSTGKLLPVRGVVVFPGWWVERTHRERRADVWVLEPKALPAFIENEPEAMAPDDVSLAAFHLSRYIRSQSGLAE